MFPILFFMAYDLFCFSVSGDWSIDQGALFLKVILLPIEAKTKLLCSFRQSNISQAKF
jgi:hypothetical protein